MARDTFQAVREACLWLPEAEEFISHGSPTFRVRGKTFATYVVNHHGDGRVALWLNALTDSRQLRVLTEPMHFFVPPYVGPRGWLGVILDRGIDWNRIPGLIREAYERSAPSALQARIGETPQIKAPAKTPTAGEIDPLKLPRAVAVLAKLRTITLSLPESKEGKQFGHPVWLAGKKTFAMARYTGNQLTLIFWVGVDQQGLLTGDPRYKIPPYFGHHGWIALDVTKACDWSEIKGLVLQSYRHYALKRMLQELRQD
ncbi:MAG: MmcQ/YjbR family DNA-binding protein [Pseudomonadota bacterium]|nr:MmcQ/YjbR family DNA-binding protein [Pseudomonadota bacterium]